MKSFQEGDIDEKFYEVVHKEDKLSVDRLVEYEQICLLTAQKLNVNQQEEARRFVDAKQMATYEQESETWLLLNILLQAQKLLPLSSIENSKVGFNCSKKALCHYLQQSNAALNKTASVKEWLQWTYLRTHSQPLDRAFDFSAQSMWGLESRETIARSSFDAEHERIVDPNGNIALCQKAWNLVRAGKEAEAVQLFDRAGQSWRAALLLGHQHADPDERAGNPYRSLFRKTLGHILGVTSDLNVYEKALLGVQGGQVHAILGACVTWEDYLWAYYVVKLESQTTMELNKFMQSNGSFLEEDDTAMPNQLILAESDIFLRLCTCEDPVVRHAAAAPFRYVQQCIVLDRLDELMATMAQWAKALTTDQGAFCGHGPHPHVVPKSVLRFAVHLLLFLEASNVWQYRRGEGEDASKRAQNAAAIIQSYVVHLSALNETSLIAYYVSLFPDLYTLHNTRKVHICTSTYATFLMSNPSVIGREREALRLAAEHGLDTVAITAHIVEQICDVAFPSTLSEEQRTQFDMSLIEQLKWLSYDLNQSFEIIKQSNKLIRRFILQNRHRSAQRTYDYLSSILPHNYLENVREMLHSARPFSVDSIATLFLAPSTPSSAHSTSPLWEQKRAQFQERLQQRLEEINDPSLYDSIFEQAREEFLQGLDESQCALLNEDATRNARGIGVQNAIREHISLFAYLKALKLYDEWKESASLRNSQNDFKLTIDLEASLFHLLKYPTGWLQDYASPFHRFLSQDALGQQREEEISAIRTRAIPQVFFLLFEVLTTSGKPDQCVELVNLATDEQFKLFSCFPKDDLKRFLGLIRLNLILAMENDIKQLSKK